MPEWCAGRDSLRAAECLAVHFYRQHHPAEGLTPGPGTIALSPASILLRGSSLRNTKSILGLVVFAGHETKVTGALTSNSSDSDHLRSV